MSQGTGLPTQADLTRTTTTLADLRQMVGNLARLCEISVILNATTDIRRLLRQIVRTAVEVLECESASILLYNEQRGELMFTATSDTDTKRLAEIPVPIEGSIAGKIFKTSDPMLINDVQNHPQHFDLVGQVTNFIPRSLVGVPMTVQGKPIGVLEALNKRTHRFTQKDVHLLAILASQAAVAINNTRLHHAVQTAYEDLRRTDKMKSDFMAIASHELRTPLGIILGYASFLKDEADGNIAGHADQILNASARLQSVVEAMTKMNTLQAGNTAAKMAALPLQKVVHAAVQDGTPSARKKHLQVKAILPREPIIVEADANQLKTACDNILSNAIQFTPRGGHVSVTVEDKGREVWVKFIDNGVGIPREHIKKVFDQFYQVEDHLTRTSEGLGLGLAIAKGIIEVHNGRVWAESEGLNKGTIVTIALPRPDGGSTYPGGG